MSQELPQVPEISEEEYLELLTNNSTDQLVAKILAESREFENSIYDEPVLENSVPQIIDVREPEEIEYCDTDDMLYGDFGENIELRTDLAGVEEKPKIEAIEHNMRFIPIESLIKEFRTPQSLTDHLDPEVPVFCLCRSGRRSVAAQIHLESLGFMSFNIKGGLIGLGRILGRKIKL